MLRGLLGNWPKRIKWTLIILIALSFVFGQQVWGTVGHDIHTVVTGLQNLANGASGK